MNKSWEPTNNEIGNWLREERKKKGLELSAAAEKVKIPKQFLVHYEAGFPVPLKTLAGLVQVYESSPEQLVKIILSRPRK